jgi:TonB family protein
MCDHSGVTGGAPFHRRVDCPEADSVAGGGTPKSTYRFMRFSARTVLALLSLTAASASLPVGAAADPAPVAGIAATPPVVICPSTHVFAARGGNTYVATFRKNAPWTGTITISFHTATDAYSVQTPVSVTKQIGASDYRSGPIAILNPSAEKFVDAKIDFGTTDDVGPCIDYFHLPDDLWTGPDAKKAFAELDPAQLPMSPVKIIGESDALTCKHSYQSVAIDGEPAELIYPLGAQQVGATGRVWVDVRLTPTGTVAEASVYRSSGNDYLDASAVRSASKTRYSPEVFRCEPVVGSYLFVANFEP